MIFVKSYIQAASMAAGASSGGVCRFHGLQKYVPRCTVVDRETIKKFGFMLGKVLFCYIESMEYHRHSELQLRRIEAGHDE